MHFRIGRSVKSLLEQDEGAYVCGFKLFVFLDSCCRYIDVYPAYGLASAVFIGIDAFHAFDYVIKWRVDRILSRFHGYSLVTEGEDGIGFFVDFLHCQFFPVHGRVVLVEAAVFASVDAEV